VYAFAREPKWILSHLFVLILVVAMIGAAFWQLDRLQQKKDRNALVTERQEEPVAPIDEIVGADQPTDVGGDVRFRRSTATGTYDVAEEVLVRNRSFDGAPGSWVLTPLLLDDGTAVVVNRGWVPVTGDLPVPPESAPPDGEVTVEGLLEESQSRGSFGPTDPSGEDLDTLSRVDLERYQEQVDYDLYPVWLQLEEQDPPPAERPELIDPPELDEGPHLSYAVQWFTFTLIALIGYPLILRRRAHQGAPEELV
jgi:surfeit locus 1 family protein